MAEQTAKNPHVAGQSRNTFIRVREARDRTLTMPRLILPALQVNTGGGRLPAAEEKGRMSESNRATAWSRSDGEPPARRKASARSRSRFRILGSCSASWRRAMEFAIPAFADPGEPSPFLRHGAICCPKPDISTEGVSLGRDLALHFSLDF